MSNITFFFFLIPALAIILLGVNLIFATHSPYSEKNSAFECGFHSFLGQNRSQFNITFYIFALLFLLFDLEILLIYPYPVSSYFNSDYGLIMMLVFFLLLTLGFAFELGKNALKIDSRQSITNNVTFKSNDILQSNIFSIFISKEFINKARKIFNNFLITFLAVLLVLIGIVGLPRIIINIHFYDIYILSILAGISAIVVRLICNIIRDEFYKNSLKNFSIYFLSGFFMCIILLSIITPYIIKPFLEYIIDTYSDDILKIIQNIMIIFSSLSTFFSESNIYQTLGENMTKTENKIPKVPKIPKLCITPTELYMAPKGGKSNISDLPYNDNIRVNRNRSNRFNVTRNRNGHVTSFTINMQQGFYENRNTNSPNVPNITNTNTPNVPNITNTNVSNVSNVSNTNVPNVPNVPNVSNVSNVSSSNSNTVTTTFNTNSNITTADVNMVNYNNLSDTMYNNNVGAGSSSYNTMYNNNAGAGSSSDRSFENPNFRRMNDLQNRRILNLQNRLDQYANVQNNANVQDNSNQQDNSNVQSNSNVYTEADLLELDMPLGDALNLALEVMYGDFLEHPENMASNITFFVNMINSNLNGYPFLEILSRQPVDAMQITYQSIVEADPYAHLLENRYVGLLQDTVRIDLSNCDWETRKPYMDMPMGQYIYVLEGNLYLENLKYHGLLWQVLHHNIRMLENYMQDPNNGIDVKSINDLLTYLCMLFKLNGETLTITQYSTEYELNHILFFLRNLINPIEISGRRLLDDINSEDSIYTWYDRNRVIDGADNFRIVTLLKHIYKHPYNITLFGENIDIFKNIKKGK